MVAPTFFQRSDIQQYMDGGENIRVHMNQKPLDNAEVAIWTVLFMWHQSIDERRSKTIRPISIPYPNE